MIQFLIMLLYHHDLKPCACDLFYPLSLHLLLFLLTTITLILLLSSSCLLPPHTAGSASTKWRGKSKVNVLLRIESNDERRDIDDLLSNAR